MVCYITVSTTVHPQKWLYLAQIKKNSNMLYSMTGYGRAETTINDYTISIDIKSLNGKQFDLGARLPMSLKPFEIQIKSMLQQILQRGSVEIYIAMKQHGSSKPMKVNTELAKYYYAAAQQIADSIAQPLQNALPIIMAMPEVVSQSTDDIGEQDWNKIEQSIRSAAQQLMQHRATEGNSIGVQLQSVIKNIESLATQVTPFEAGRATKQKEKLLALLADQVGDANVDKNRLEQEIIFYLEKFDIAEEKIRLAHHCNYFKEVVAEQTEQKGKKLGFIMQEIGREINTMGSKANDVNIQKLVVQMKDELEKAKEQTLNIL
jgi:uncharacterized protein (TIGR00255 family)